MDFVCTMSEISKSPYEALQGFPMRQGRTALRNISKPCHGPCHGPYNGIATVLPGGSTGISAASLRTCRVWHNQKWNAVFRSVHMRIRTWTRLNTGCNSTYVVDRRNNGSARELILSLILSIIYCNSGRGLSTPHVPCLHRNKYISDISNIQYQGDKEQDRNDEESEKTGAYSESTGHGCLAMQR